MLTTFSSYGDVAAHWQAEIIRTLGIADQRAGMQVPTTLQECGVTPPLNRK